MGRRGTLVISAPLREEYGLADGQDVIQEPTPKGILIRPSFAVPLRKYSAEEKASFILNAAATDAEYAEAIASVKAMGLDPKKIPHRRARK